MSMASMAFQRHGLSYKASACDFVARSGTPFANWGVAQRAVVDGGGRDAHPFLALACLAIASLGGLVPSGERRTVPLIHIMRC